MCVRETEAVIVKHQLIVQLLLKDMRKRERETRGSAHKQKRASSHNGAENKKN